MILYPQSSISSNKFFLVPISFVILQWTSWPVCFIAKATGQVYSFDMVWFNALCNKGWHFWKGGFVTDKTGLKIFVFINAMIFAFTTFVTNPPLYGKIASKVWKIYFQYISPHFLDAAGSQISDLWLLFSALMSHLPLLLLHSALCTGCWTIKHLRDQGFHQ